MNEIHNWNTFLIVLFIIIEWWQQIKLSFSIELKLMYLNCITIVIHNTIGTATLDYKEGVCVCVCVCVCALARSVASNSL